MYFCHYHHDYNAITVPLPYHYYYHHHNNDFLIEFTPLRVIKLKYYVKLLLNLCIHDHIDHFTNTHKLGQSGKLSSDELNARSTIEPDILRLSHH